MSRGGMGESSTQEELSSTFSRIHNHIYANDGSSPEEALEETVKLLFIKTMDEKEQYERFFIEDQEVSEIDDRGFSESFDKRINQLSRAVFESFPDLFDHGESLRLKSGSIGFAVRALQGFRLSQTSRDIKGVAFQRFISASHRVGRGQFFTPEPVVDLAVEMLRPASGEIVVDPACGSGGFLASAYLKTAELADGPCLPIGIEISKNVARFARMRFALMEADVNVVCGDALGDLMSFAPAIPQIRSDGGFADIALTNPPFGTQGKISNRSILSRFTLGHRERSGRPSDGAGPLMQQQIPEILFIEQTLKMLRPGGRLAIVLPNGQLENQSLTYVRNFILNYAHIDAIIRLPQETFIPSGTGIKTSLVCLTKHGKRRPGRNIFFGEVTALGYQGNKNGTSVFKRSSDGAPVLSDSGELVIDEDATAVAKFFHQRKRIDPTADPRYFELSSSEVSSKRFDFEFYHPRHEQLRKTLTRRGAAPLGDLVALSKVRHPSLEFSDQRVGYIELSDIAPNYQEITSSEEMLVHELPSRATFLVRRGQIITAIAGNSVGTTGHASALVSDKYDGFICSNGFRVLSPNESEINPHYLLFALSGEAFLQQAFRARTGAAIPAISDDDLLEILIPRQEQELEKLISTAVERGILERTKLEADLADFRLKLA